MHMLLEYISNRADMHRLLSISIDHGSWHTDPSLSVLVSFTVHGYGAMRLRGAVPESLN